MKFGGRSVNMKKISELSEREQQRVIADLATPDQFDTSIVKALYYGHSFVNHYVKWERRNPEFVNLGFDQKDLLMFYHGDGGANIDNLLQDHNLEHVERIAPELVVVEVGTNDIANDMFGPSLLELKVETLIKELKDRRVRFVVINQVLYRGEAAYPDMSEHDRKQAMKLFQCKTVSYNMECERRINNIPNCMFKKHQGLWSNIEQCVNKRGVHLNDAGHKKLYNSLRSGVMRAMKRIRPAKYRQQQIEVLA